MLKNVVLSFAAVSLLLSTGVKALSPARPQAPQVLLEGGVVTINGERIEGSFDKRVAIFQVSDDNYIIRDASRALLIFLDVREDERAPHIYRIGEVKTLAVDDPGTLRLLDSYRLIADNFSTYFLSSRKNGANSIKLPGIRSEEIRTTRVDRKNLLVLDQDSGVVVNTREGAVYPHPVVHPASLIHVGYAYWKDNYHVYCLPYMKSQASIIDGAHSDSFHKEIRRTPNGERALYKDVHGEFIECERNESN